MSRSHRRGSLLAGPVASATNPRQAELKITRIDPLTVHGSGFRRSEHVRVLLRTATTTVAHNAPAGSHGAFHTSFAGIKLGHCGGFSITATGATGNSATVSRHIHLPACNPA